ncbi:hypothetical protein [Kocuria sp. ICS0012]|uniref:hypothetical protein n=1 Tax=Kocuria sp. ICS0012 TaxID=1834155 RepID=UPI000AE7FC4B|nr:hypothetical protein [Kocuria sp. ICS0012]
MHLDGAKRQNRMGEPLMRMTFRMPGDLYEAVTQAAQDAGLSRTAWIISIVARHLNYPEHDSIPPAQD